MPWVDAKCASFTLIRFEECLEWCKERTNELPGAGPDEGDSVLSSDVEMAYRMSVLAEQSLLEQRQLEGDRRSDKDRAIAEVLKGKKERRRPTDKAIYLHLSRGFAEENGYDLPIAATWTRYVRKGRRHFGTNKNNTRAGRTGRSIVNLREV